MATASGTSHPGAAHRKYLLVLGVIFGVIWTTLAIDPWHRDGWALENALVVAFVLFVALGYKRLTLSRVSYTMIFLFLCLHEIGSHYTYAEVPYDAWFKALTGETLNSLLGWERNNFDRVVFRLRTAARVPGARGLPSRGGRARVLGYFLPLDLTMSTSMIFELFEWVAAALFGGELGQAYLGTQGDVWDAHKDMRARQPRRPHRNARHVCRQPIAATRLRLGVGRACA